MPLSVNRGSVESGVSCPILGVPAGPACRAEDPLPGQADLEAASVHLASPTPGAGGLCGAAGRQTHRTPPGSCEPHAPEADHLDRLSRAYFPPINLLW